MVALSLDVSRRKFIISSVKCRTPISSLASDQLSPSRLPRIASASPSNVDTAGDSSTTVSAVARSPQGDLLALG